MDRRFLTVLGVSLVFALVVSSIFYQFTARSGPSKKAEATDMRDIIVTTRALGVGVMIRPADVKISKIPAEAFPKGGYSKVEEVLDRPVISNILMEEPILDGRLAVKGSGLGLAPTIPVGMRAVSVRVNDVAGVAGFVLPGMKVDVLVTGRPPGDDGDITATALQNILVLSAGTTLQPDARGQAMPAPTVTLLATPEEAEILTLANMDGHIQLVLRNSSDQDMGTTPGRYISELYGTHRRAPIKNSGKGPDNDGTGDPRPKKPVQAAAPRPAAPAPAPPVQAAVVVAPPPPPPPDQIVEIRGTNKGVETIVNHSN
ncbi:MAG TPA: Flp pilus assembly protein CpaB [Bryobacteraceae bacterium]|jgi:pilus assembly protein CpaB